MKVVGYARVSTEEQSNSGLGLKAQRSAIVSEADRRGWELVGVHEDKGISGKSMVGRPALVEALSLVESGKAEALLVSKLDRLSRSLLDFAALMERSRKKGWALVALDLGVDTTTPAGEMVANVMSSFAQYERRLIGQRTKDALAMKKADGIKLGRPRTLTHSVVRQIEALRQEGLSLRGIAERLDEAGVPTAQGGRRWHASTVKSVLERDA